MFNQLKKRTLVVSAKFLTCAYSRVKLISTPAVILPLGIRGGVLFIMARTRLGSFSSRRRFLNRFKRLLR